MAQNVCPRLREIALRTEAESHNFGHLCISASRASASGMFSRAREVNTHFFMHNSVVLRHKLMEIVEIQPPISLAKDILI